MLNSYIVILLETADFNFNGLLNACTSKDFSQMSVLSHLLIIEWLKCVMKM